jgi:hypothetical protein
MSTQLVLSLNLEGLTKNLFEKDGKGRYFHFAF